MKLDSEAVSEALINLIDNAYKYSTDDKIIQIRTGRSGFYVFVEVEDHGVGITEDDQKKIFDNFTGLKMETFIIQKEPAWGFLW